MADKIDVEMLEWLNDPDVGRRSVAIGYLGEVDTREALEILLRKAESEKDEWTFAYILCTINEMHLPEKAAIFSGILNSLTDPYLIFTFMLFAGEYRIVLDNKSIIKSLSYVAWFVRLAIARYLHSIDQTEGVEEILVSIRRELTQNGLGNIKPDVCSFQGYEVLYSKEEALRRVDELIANGKWELQPLENETAT